MSSGLTEGAMAMASKEAALEAGKGVVLVVDDEPELCRALG